MAEFTPMMQHYLQTKEEYKDCILFYRLGDFYEMFFDDAVLVSKELELTLTGKSCGMEERAPMCGIPYHAVEGYLNRLVANGHKVAICEQVEDPKLAKGIVKREVIRVVTPGTNMDIQALDESKNNYIMCIVYLADKYGISLADVSTGDYYVTEVDSERKLIDEINKFAPSEIVCNESFYMSGVDLEDMRHRLGITIYSLDAWYFSDETAETTLKGHFHVNSLEGLGLNDYAYGTIAAGALLKYLYETQKNNLDHISAIHPYSTGKFMIIDSSTRRNLELVETMREKQKRGSLLWVLDKTKTAMGARLLRSYVEQPLIDKAEIEKRQDAIADINKHMITREELREYLNPIYDLERLITRVTYMSANPRDLIAFKNSIGMLPPIKTLLEDFDTELLKELQTDMDPLEELYQLIDASIMEEPPISVREGGLIKDGYNENVDKYRHAKTEGKTWLAELEAKEREKTGIKNLKIKFNKVFGYYLEVTNSYRDLVPDYFTRKQTLANAERYITPELKELEDMILGAEDKLINLEYDLFCEVRNRIAAEVVRIQKTAKAVAKLDTFVSLAVVADKNNYYHPKSNDHGVIDVKDGRRSVSGKNKKLVDWIAKHGTVCEAVPASLSEFVRQLCSQAKQAGCTLAESDAEEIVSRCNGDTLLLRSELEKLCACADGGTITREMIQDLVLPTVSATTFSLAGAVVQQRATAAMQALEQLFTMRVERPVLLAALNSAFLDLYRAAAAVRNHIPQADMKQDFGYRFDFQVRNAYRDCSRIPIARIRACLAILRDLEQTCNSTAIPERTAIETAIVKMLTMPEKQEDSL